MALVILHALVNGYLDDVEITKVQDFEAAFLNFMGSNHPDILSHIADTKDVTDETGASLNSAIEEFKAGVPY